MQGFSVLQDLGDCVNNQERMGVIELRLDTIDGRLDAALGKAKKPRSRKTNIVLVFTVIPVLFMVFGFLYHYAELELDKHIDLKLTAALAPVKDDVIAVHKDMQQLSGDVREIKGILSVLQAPALSSRFSKLPSGELKSRKEELKQIKDNLAAAPKDTPNLWPASFQIITLLSQAMYQLETIGRQPLTELDNVRIQGFGQRGGLVNGRNVLLKNEIEGFSFENSVIHFDASTKLTNVQFTHCVFIFPTSPTPSKSLQDIGATLLTSDLERVKITAG